MINGKANAADNEAVAVSARAGGDGSTGTGFVDAFASLGSYRSSRKQTTFDFITLLFQSACKQCKICRGERRVSRFLCNLYDAITGSAT
ncbi:MAG: hypothetical protein ACKOAH_14315, partial [Pirellula sp.]